jgi:hypothetical protein
MKRAVLLVCCLLPACPPTNPSAPVAPASCRESDGPADCKPPLGIGGHQGGLLEGTGLERLHFAVPPGAFPPAAGTTLTAVDACGTPSTLRVRVNVCAPVTELPGADASACLVDVVGEPPASLVPALPPLCATTLSHEISDPDPTHHRGVIAVRGFWDASGAWQNTPNTITLSCDATSNSAGQQQFEAADGSITKCLRTWQLDPKSETEAFLGCIRMARGDYCGDGHPHTYGGTEVSLATPKSPMTSAECKDGFCFEASWNRNGAVCLSRPRWTGRGMENDACRPQFTQHGALFCRGQPEQAIVFSRSAQHVCKQVPTIPCAPDQDPVCVSQ